MVNQFIFKRTVIYLEYQISTLDDAILFLTVNINVRIENQVYRSFFSHFMKKKSKEMFHVCKARSVLTRIVIDQYSDVVICKTFHIANYNRVIHPLILKHYSVVFHFSTFFI